LIVQFLLGFDAKPKSQLKQIVDALGHMAQCGQNNLHGRLNREYPPYRWDRVGAIILHKTQESESM
jgi:hypothetical protein